MAFFTLSVVNAFSFFLSVVFILLGMAFFTLCERNLLGYIHLRNGPNKVGYLGLVQPFADAGKLFLNERLNLLFTDNFCYFSGPLLLLFTSIFFWCLYPLVYSYMHVENSVLLFLCVSSVSVYGTVMVGWGSNSKYALLGTVRAVAQTVSYEVSLSFILLSPVLIMKSFIISEIYADQVFVYNLCLFVVNGLIWFVTVLAETNRAPFDFVEGESELVSGFNVEYGGYSFAIIFMAEYMNILFMSVVSVCLFIGVNSHIFVGICVLVSYIFVWVRGAYPRLRYDLLMALTWKCFLPVGLAISSCLVAWGLIF